MDALAVLLLNALTLIQHMLVNGNGRLETREKEEKRGHKILSLCVCVHL